MTKRLIFGITSVCIAALSASACATTQEAVVAAPPEPQWAANGWLSPNPDSDPEIIGLYVTRDECEGAVADWMSSQVVGNPVSGECLPIDSH